MILMTKKKPVGRPRKNTRKRRNSGTFMSESVREMNTEIKEAYTKVTGRDMLWETYDKIIPGDAEAIFKQYKGRCVYCTKALSSMGRVSSNSARLAFYVPLKVGGEARPSNLVVTCAPCKNDYTYVPKQRTDIVGLDSFADVCEVLFKAVRDGASEETRERLKNRLNLRLADIATCMGYVVKSDWIPTDEIVEEGVNTIGEQLEGMAEGEDTKDAITNTVKQVAARKQYNIIRNQGDG
ncbi:hypothetical protein LCGC14_2423000 [marine sediment metagenome]|uniref:Uncharacterized protein n=1 Tax=marine sediment metagenome TaxID=412755 RepID=A0A0F9BP81_9ZZZZ